LFRRLDEPGRDADRNRCGEHDADSITNFDASRVAYDDAHSVSDIHLYGAADGHARTDVDRDRCSDVDSNAHLRANGDSDADRFRHCQRGAECEPDIEPDGIGDDDAECHGVARAYGRADSDADVVSRGNPA